MSQTHHDTSHHGQQPDKMAQHAKVNTYFTVLFGTFLERLRAAPEGEGSVLDNSLIAYGTGMSDGQAHNSYPLPFALVGGAGGRMRGNRYLVAPEWTSMRITTAVSFLLGGGALVELTNPFSSAQRQQLSNFATSHSAGGPPASV